MILRTKINNQIICEFIPPLRVIKHLEVELDKKSRRKELNRRRNLEISVDHAKVIILAVGAPGGPFKNGLMEYWSKKGYWVFNPRYRGTWESDGKFMAKEPTQDLIDVIDVLPKGFIEGWDGTKFKVQFKKLYLFGGSFGGPAVLLASKDKRVDRVVAIAPVVEWKNMGPVETFDKFQSFTQMYFGPVYRGTKQSWLNLKNEKLYTPLKQTDKIDGKKILIIENKDDKSVPWRSVARFAKKVGATLKLYKTGGHIGIGAILEPRNLKTITRFLKS